MITSWNDLKYFKKRSTLDNWGEPNKMDLFLLQFLDELREAMGVPLLVTSGYRKGSSGFHGLGRAVDVVAPKFEGHLFDMYLLAERFGFGGIGVYRDWVYNGGRCGGLHLDTRLGLQETVNNLKGSRWLGVRRGSEGMSNTTDIMKVKQIYLPLDVKTLRQEGII